MNVTYKPKSFKQKLGQLIEECGEVQAAIGKSLRFGLHSYNPEIPSHKREMNGDWILRELDDLKQAIALVEKSLKRTMGRD